MTKRQNNKKISLILQFLFVSAVILFIEYLVMIPIIKRSGTSFIVGIKQMASFKNVNDIANFDDGSLVSICGIINARNNEAAISPISNTDNLVYYSYSAKYREHTGDDTRTVRDGYGISFVPMEIELNGGTYVINGFPGVVDALERTHYRKVNGDFESENLSQYWVSNSTHIYNSSSAYKSSVEAYRATGNYSEGFIADKKGTGRYSWIDEDYIWNNSSVCVSGIWNKDVEQIENYNGNITIVVGDKVNLKSYITRTQVKSVLSIVVLSIFILSFNVFVIALFVKQIKKIKTSSK